VFSTLHLLTCAFDIPCILVQRGCISFHAEPPRRARRCGPSASAWLAPFRLEAWHLNPRCSASLLRFNRAPINRSRNRSSRTKPYRDEPTTTFWHLTFDRAFAEPNTHAVCFLLAPSFRPPSPTTNQQITLPGWMLFAITADSHQIACKPLALTPRTYRLLFTLGSDKVRSGANPRTDLLWSTAVPTNVPQPFDLPTPVCDSAFLSADWPANLFLCVKLSPIQDSPRTFAWGCSA